MTSSLDLSLPIDSLTRSLIAPKPGSENHNPNDWRHTLKKTEKGMPIPNESNLALVLSAAPEFRAKICYDVFSSATMTKDRLPWKRKNTPLWQEEDTLQFLGWLQKRGLPRLKLETVHQGVKLAALYLQVNPIKDYLESLKWDGTARLDNWLTAYMGVADSDYTKAIGPKVLISAVARVYEPGCKVDTVLVLEGQQGAFKSTSIKVLFGEAYVSDQLPDLSNKDASIQLQGQWAVEIAELSSLKRSEVEDTKSFISRNVDHYRAPYAHDAVKRPRSCIFIATTNDSTYLKDPSGARRFWPVKCDRADLKALEKDRDQIWAEAVQRYKAKEPWHLSLSEQTMAMKVQEERYDEDAWADALDMILSAVANGKISVLNQRPKWSVIQPKLVDGKITISQISQVLGLRLTDQDALSKHRITRHLQHRKWEQKKSGSHRWYKPTDAWRLQQAQVEDTDNQLAPYPNLDAVIEYFEGPYWKDVLTAGESKASHADQAEETAQVQSSLKAEDFPSDVPYEEAKGVDYEPERFPSDMTFDEAMAINNDQSSFSEDLIFSEQQKADIELSAITLRSLLTKTSEATPPARPDLP